MNNPADTSNRIETVERSLRLAREASIFVGILFVAIYFLPVLGQLRTLLATGKLAVDSLNFGPISVKLKTEEITTFRPPNITLEAVSGSDQRVLEKASFEVLEKTKADLAKAGNGARIDVIQIVPEKQYNGSLLQQYISLLGARFIIFQDSKQGSKLDGWTDASSFAAQLLPTTNYDYDHLLHQTVGVNYNFFAATNSKALDVLSMMQKNKLDNIAVVDTNNRFAFMVSGQEILSKVVTQVILEEQRGKGS